MLLYKFYSSATGLSMARFINHLSPPEDFPRLLTMPSQHFCAQGAHCGTTTSCDHGSLAQKQISNWAARQGKHLSPRFVLVRWKRNMGSRANPGKRCLEKEDSFFNLKTYFTYVHCMCNARETFCYWHPNQNQLMYSGFLSPFPIHICPMPTTSSHSRRMHCFCLSSHL